MSDEKEEKDEVLGRIVIEFTDTDLRYAAEPEEMSIPAIVFWLNATQHMIMNKVTNQTEEGTV